MRMRTHCESRITATRRIDFGERGRERKGERERERERERKRERKREREKERKREREREREKERGGNVRDGASDAPPRRVVARTRMQCDAMRCDASAALMSSMCARARVRYR